MSTYTLDVSVAVKWYFNEPMAEPAIKLLAGGHTLHVPDLIYAEFGNVLWKKVGHGLASPAHADRLARTFARIPFMVFSSASLMAEALAIAVEHRRTMYDSLYVALARRTDAPLVTADERLVNSLANTSLSQHLRWLGNPDFA